MKICQIAIAAALAGVTGAHAATVIVTAGDVGTTPSLNQWYLTNFRDTSTGYTSTTSAAVTTTNARSGNGSVEMSLSDGTGKADYAYTWGFVNGHTLGNLSALSYEWYRDSASTNSDKQSPALRLLFDADGNAATANDRGYLVFEDTYQPSNASGIAATDTWVMSNALGGEFWQRRFSPGTTIEQFDTDLSEWAAGASYAGALVLSGSSAILGIEFGIGSGWNGGFRGFVDNVSYGFGTAQATTFNFEGNGTAVPEPATLALVGLSLLGLAATRRRS